MDLLRLSPGSCQFSVNGSEDIGTYINEIKDRVGGTVGHIDHFYVLTGLLTEHTYVLIEVNKVSL